MTNDAHLCRPKSLGSLKVITCGTFLFLGIWFLFDFSYMAPSSCSCYLVVFIIGAYVILLVNCFRAHQLDFSWFFVPVYCCIYYPVPLCKSFAASRILNGLLYLIEVKIRNDMWASCVQLISFSCIFMLIYSSLAIFSCQSILERLLRLRLLTIVLIKA